MCVCVLDILFMLLFHMLSIYIYIYIYIKLYIYIYIKRLFLHYFLNKSKTTNHRGIGGCLLKSRRPINSGYLEYICYDKEVIYFKPLE